MSRVFLDTNVLVYVYDRHESEKQNLARDLYRGLAAEDRVVLSTQVLQEFYWTLTRRLRAPVSEAAAHEAVELLLFHPIVQVTTSVIKDGIRRSRVEQLPFWDALIVEAALAAGATVLYSEDFQHGRAFGNMEVHNPFS